MWARWTRHDGMYGSCFCTGEVQQTKRGACMGSVVVIFFGAGESQR